MADLAKLKSDLNSDAAKAKFTEMIGKKAPGFITSVINCVNNNQLLQKADNRSILMAASVAASVDLPIIPSLGMAYIVPYKGDAQFQLGYKGLIELCQRSGQFLSIIDEVVYEGQLVKKNRFTGDYEFNEDAKKSDKVIGYMAYFKLTSGFEKTMFMTIDEIKKHATQFSQSFRNKAGIWTDNFDAMARKTVLKMLLGKYAPKSVELQRAIIFDQAVVKGDPEHIEDAQPIYADNMKPDSGDQAAEFLEQQKKAERKVEDVEPVNENPENAQPQDGGQGGDLFNGEA